MTTMTSTPVRFETPTGYKDEIAARSDAVRWLRIPARRYLVIDGTEAPGTPEFKDAIGTLYPVAYTLHFALKARRVDAPVGALQGLYRLGGQPVTSIDEARDAPFVTGGWLWRLMLPIPEAAATEEIEAAIRDVRAKKQPPRIGELWAFTWEEGLGRTDHAHRCLRRRTADDRQAATGRHRCRAHGTWRPPRDLHQ